MESLKQSSPLKKFWAKILVRVYDNKKQKYFKVKKTNKITVSEKK